MLYCQSCGWRWDVAVHSCSLGSVSLPPLSWGCGVVLGMLAGRGAEMGALGNEAVSALGVHQKVTLLLKCVRRE